jgi:hypothetical protein
MKARALQLTALAALVIGLTALAVALWTKRHDRRLAVARALAATALQKQLGSAGPARGLRIPFYENEARLATSVMFGRTAEPAEGGKYNVTELHVENYSYVSNTVVTNYIIEAPQCLIDPQQKTARSAGRIVVSRPDGAFMTTGIGFEFRQIDSILNISNNVMTHLEPDKLKRRPAYSP